VVQSLGVKSASLVVLDVLSVVSELVSSVVNVSSSEQLINKLVVKILVTSNVVIFKLMVFMSLSLMGW
jgi:hypothetical protein